MALQFPLLQEFLVGDMVDLMPDEQYWRIPFGDWMKHHWNNIYIVQYDHCQDPTATAKVAIAFYEEYLNHQKAKKAPDDLASTP